MIPIPDGGDGGRVLGNLEHHHRHHGHQHHLDVVHLLREVDGGGLLRGVGLLPLCSALK